MSSAAALFRKSERPSDQKPDRRGQTSRAHVNNGFLLSRSFEISDQEDLQLLQEQVEELLLQPTPKRPRGSYRRGAAVAALVYRKLLAWPDQQPVNSDYAGLEKSRFSRCLDTLQDANLVYRSYLEDASYLIVLALPSQEETPEMLRLRRKNATDHIEAKVTTKQPELLRLIRIYKGIVTAQGKAPASELDCRIAFRNVLRSATADQVIPDLVFFFTHAQMFAGILGEDRIKRYGMTPMTFYRNLAAISDECKSERARYTTKAGVDRGWYLTDFRRLKLEDSLLA